jgi:hypothetical protein
VTPIGSAAIALGFAVFANFQGAYLKDSSDEIEYLDQQASLHTGGCSGRCQYQMWMDRYPSIVLGESYNGDDPMNQALREFDPQFENPQARECAHLRLELRPWNNRPGRGGFMPGPQPGCKDDGVTVDYPPIWAQPEKHRPSKALGKNEMPKLLIPDNWTFPYISYLPKLPYVIGLTDSTKEGINVPTYPHPEVAEAESVPLATPLP